MSPTWVQAVQRKGKRRASSVGVGHEQQVLVLVLLSRLGRLEVKVWDSSGLGEAGIIAEVEVLDRGLHGM